MSVTLPASTCPHGRHGNTSLVGDAANGSTPSSAVWWRLGRVRGFPYVSLASQPECFTLCTIHQVSDSGPYNYCLWCIHLLGGPLTWPKFQKLINRLFRIPWMSECVPSMEGWGGDDDFEKGDGLWTSISVCVHMHVLYACSVVTYSVLAQSVSQL